MKTARKLTSAVLCLVIAVAVLTRCGKNSASTAVTVTAISPATGSTHGLTRVTITGTNFKTGATVTMGTARSAACVSTSVVSSTQIACTTPAYAPVSVNAVVNVVVTNTDAQSGTLRGGFTFVAPELSTWPFTDGDAATGINKDTSKNAYNPQFAVLNSKLYAAWYETNGTAPQIRVAVYNGNDSTPAWAFVDGGGTTGLNKDATKTADDPQLVAFGGKLYAAWYENNGTANQIRVAVYNGNDSTPAWTFVDGGGTHGINVNAARAAFRPQFATFSSKLYVTWTEHNGTDYQVRVAVYNGNDGSPSWSMVDGGGANGINKDPTKYTDVSRLATFNSKLYATWIESDTAQTQIRVAVYNGNDGAPTWTFVDGNSATVGINKDPTKNANYPYLATFNSKLYATWQESNGTKYQIRAAVYGGNDASPAWTFIDGNGTNGLNKDATQAAQLAQLAVFNSKLYLTWGEGTTGQIRVAVYSGNDASPAWTFVDGNGTTGINKDTTKFAFGSVFAIFNSELYVTWCEISGTASQIRVAVGQ